VQKKTISLIALAFLMQGDLPGATGQAVAQSEKNPYPVMAPLNQYLSPGQNSEIALARSAAPASISDRAEVMVLGREGYTTAVKGTNGFLCIVERSWGAGDDEPYLFGRSRVSGPDGEHRSYRSFASFHDPDGNGWLFQEITARLPGRIDPATTTFASVSDLASAFRRAAAAHGQHEARTGQADPNWPDWYAEYMVREQAGEELPQ
jgi:hypothetical protein